MKALFTSTILIIFSLGTQAQILKFGDKQGFRIVDGQGHNLVGGLSNDDIISGLKEALGVGVKNTTNLVSKPGGYLDNLQIKIPFPPEAQKVQDVAKSLGMQKQVDDFVKSLNAAAEEAAKTAAQVFFDAIKQMTIEDGTKILTGRDNEATLYLQSKTSATLKAKYKPIVKAALDKVQVTKYWTPLANSYDVPFVQKVNPDLEDYTTQKALDGLFYMVALEETKIRRDPGARVTATLKKVFAGAENTKTTNPPGGVRNHN